MSASPLGPVCTQGHPLAAFEVPDTDWYCSECEQDQKQGTTMYGCNECEYDLCEACAGRGRPSRASGSDGTPLLLTQPVSPLRRSVRELRNDSHEWAASDGIIAAAAGTALPPTAPPTPGPHSAATQLSATVELGTASAGVSRRDAALHVLGDAVSLRHRRFRYALCG
eukprot:gene4447-5805_t